MRDPEPIWPDRGRGCQCESGSLIVRGLGICLADTLEFGCLERVGEALLNSLDALERSRLVGDDLVEGIDLSLEVEKVGFDALETHREIVRAAHDAGVYAAGDATANDGNGAGSGRA